jgi:hypothetical protein
MRSSAMARRFGAFSAVTLAGAAVLVFHTAAFAQQSGSSKDNAAKKATKDAVKNAAKDETAKNVAKDDAAKDADTKNAAKDDAAKDADTAPTPEADTKAAPAQQALPPGYSPPPGYRRPPPPPQGYPQPPAEEPGYEGPYQHDGYDGPPPPPYGYPPPRYYRRYAPPPPVRYYPEPLSYRPFFFGFGLGVSGLGVFPNQSDAKNASRMGLGYNLHLGFGVSPRWALVLAADGATAYFDDNLNVSESSFTVGPQFWVTRKLYVRAGIGAASRTYDYGDYYNPADGYTYRGQTESESGMGAAAAVGLEFMQSYHVAFSVEANGTVGYYPNKDTLSTFGINFVMNLF